MYDRIVKWLQMEGSWQGSVQRAGCPTTTVASAAVVSVSILLHNYCGSHIYYTTVKERAIRLYTVNTSKYVGIIILEIWKDF